MSEEVRNVNYVGIDIGSTASKVVVRGTSDMQFVLPTGWSSKETTQTIKEKLKEMMWMSWEMRRKSLRPGMAGSQ